MGSTEGMTTERFGVLEDPRPDDTSLPPFMVSKPRGFLPRMDPVAALPPEFAAVESLLRRMPVKTLAGEPGLLAEGKLGDAVRAELPDLTAQIGRYEGDLPLMNALYRDYSFLASAFLLEPCHMRFLRGEPYGLGRGVLPACISRPIVRLAEVLEFKPFMEYAGSYALYNYRLADPALGLQYSNLRLIRAFEHGLDPTSSEAGFVLVHVDMALNSGALVSGTCACLDACPPPPPPASSSSPSSADAAAAAEALAQRRAFNGGLAAIVSALKRINAVMETMWMKSKPANYTSFRTFIFGIASQSMFPEGVVYEGVNGDRPMSFRGESGANDSMIPLMDSLLQVPMPDTPLTQILRDFREYRPSNHRQFLAFVADRARELGLKEYALGMGCHLQRPEGEGDEERELLAELAESRRLWLRALNEVRDFRWRHWCFGKEYILKRTSHPTATGGSPIVTWLPNQLQAVLAEMAALYEGVVAAGSGEDLDLGGEVGDIMDLVARQREMLAKEVRKYCEERGVPSAATAGGGEAVVGGRA